MEMAVKSYPFAVNLYWHLQAKRDSKLHSEKLGELIHDCEMAIAGTESSAVVQTLYAFPLDSEEIAGRPHQSRHEYFLYQSNFLYFLTSISLSLFSTPTPSRSNFLRSSLQSINHILTLTRIKHLHSPPYLRHLFRGVVLPFPFLNNKDGGTVQVVRVVWEKADWYRTRCRVPYKVFLETVEVAEEGNLDENREIRDNSDSAILAENSEIEGNLEEKRDINLENWPELEQNLRHKSQFGGFQSWKLRGFIVKGDDDLRQELLAMQFIKRVSEILQSANIHAYLHPYAIYATSSNTGLIEYLPNTISLSSLHTQYHSLLSYFIRTFSGDFHTAQTNFTESLAGYSLISYLLNVKDRHNGNILIDSQGHIIHIDFGFLLTSSPGGNLNFETAPFKLTREMLELLLEGGNELFEYFKVILLQGLLELRRHREELMLLVEMMVSKEPLACLLRPEEALSQLNHRFHLAKTEIQCIKLISEWVVEAAENWRTEKYDAYQRYSNGIR